MLDGELALAVQGHTTRYRSGEVFTLGAACEHSEQFGDTPARYLVGRKYP